VAFQNWLSDIRFAAGEHETGWMAFFKISRTRVFAQEFGRRLETMSPPPPSKNAFRFMADGQGVEWK